MGKSSKTRRERWPTVVDLFSGSGAVTAALKARHFRLVAAIDNDPIACRTFKRNHPTTNIIEADKSMVGSMLSEQIEISILIG